jgi:hypothetical protein
MDRRQHHRYVKRLKVKFYSNGFAHTGISSNISAEGLFIRTNKGFTPDTIIGIEMVMPDNSVSNLKGIVIRTIKTPFSTMKNGMGVKLLEKDIIFMDFVQSLSA